MHELSIVSSLLDLCKDQALENKACKIEEIHVKLGRLSGVEVELFEKCFDFFKQEDELYRKARLVILKEEVQILCLSCEKTSILKQNVFKCLNCESVNVKIVAGEDMYLSKLVMS